MKIILIISLVVLVGCGPGKHSEINKKEPSITIRLNAGIYVYTERYSKKNDFIICYNSWGEKMSLPTYNITFIKEKP